MKVRQLKILGAVGVAALVATACSTTPKGDPDPRWADYQSWTKITEGRVTTGPSPSLGTVHMGSDGYRDVYVNEVGKAMLTGSAPYNFPAGTVIVKEQFKNKAAWESGSGAAVTVSLKTQDGSGADNWEWAEGLRGKAGPSAFCSGCHTAAIASDYVFTHEDYLSSRK